VATEQQIKNLVEQVHPLFKDKHDMWIQISKSYSGGKTYRDGNYLHRFSQREPLKSYEARKKRAVFFNNTQPLADILSGFLFSREPERENVPYDYLVKRANLYQDINVFMQMASLNSLMMSCGILVDSPKFNPAIIQSKADRENNNVNPYAVFYFPWQIRNFSFGQDGKLEALLLDNTRYNNDDFFAKAKIEYKMTLWTPKYFQEFTSKKNAEERGGEEHGQFGISGYTGKYEAGEEYENPCGEIPFQFLNWRDRTNTHLTDTIFDDIVMFDQAVYNYMSLMDEMLFGGVFKFVFWPGTIPPALLSEEGIANTAFLSFDPSVSHAPFFAGAGLGDVQQFLLAMQFYLSSIKRTLGMDTDQEKQYAQSGQAKRFDFTKVVSLLNAGSAAMEKAEGEMFRHAGLWENQAIDPENIGIEYRRDFLGEDEEKDLARMFEIIMLPYRELRKLAAKRITQLSFGDNTKDEDIKAAMDDIDATESKKPDTAPNPKALALIEKLSRQQLGTQGAGGDAAQKIANQSLNTEVTNNE